MNSNYSKNNRNQTKLTAVNQLRHRMLLTEEN